MRLKYTGLVTLLLILSMMTCAVHAQQTPDVAVKVSRQILADGQVIYRYRVVNGSSKKIVGLAIGSDYFRGVSELATPPAGWNINDGIPANNSASPLGWHVDVISSEDSALTELEWRNDGSENILPGQTLFGFGITVSHADDKYSTGHWTVFLGDSTTESALLVPDTDTTPPVITVVLTPDTLSPPNHKLVQITANISVHDDVDPNPQVKLVSITSNEAIDSNADVSGAVLGTDSRNFFLRAERTGQNKPGRIYTVVYSATDASGNTAIATATATVPHDDRHQ